MILLGGGHCCGKKTAAELLKSEIATRFPRLAIKTKHISNVSNEPTILNQYMDDVIIMYGLDVLNDPHLRSKAKVSIFLDSPPDVRLTRWIKRDVLQLPVENQREQLKIVLNKYLASRDHFNDQVILGKSFADLILPRTDFRGIDIIVDGIQSELESKSEILGSMNSSISGISSMSLSGTGLDKHRDSPSLLSLSQENFSSSNKRFYDLN